MPVDIKTVIAQAQGGILQQLIDLVPKDRRNEAVQLVEQFEQANRAIRSISPTGRDLRYAACQYVIDAIKLFLEDIDRPANREEIIDGVISAGFRPGKEARTRGDIKKSLTMYLQGQASGAGEIKQHNGLIGLAHWEDARFKSLR